MAHEASNEWLGVGSLSQVDCAPASVCTVKFRCCRHILTNILHYIIAERILDQWKGVPGYLTDEVDLLNTRSMVDTSLKHTAAVTVCSDNNAVETDSVKDELVSVSISGEFHDGIRLT